LSKPPEPPDFLGDEAKIEWNRVVPELLRLRLLTILDLGPLAAYCQSYGRWVEAERVLAEMAAEDPETKGLTVKGAMGAAIINPLLRVARASAEDMLRFAAEFGFSPASRTKVSAGIGPEKPSKFGDLLA
jgi:P27 family predicted phage terminase small subunit